MAKLNADTSIVDYLKKQGQDSSFSARKNLATEMGITNYVGSDTQNIQLLKQLQGNSSATNTVTEPKKNNSATEPKKNNTPKIKGSTEDLDARRNQEFKASDTVNEAKTDMTSGKDTLNALVNKENIIDPSVMNSLNSSFSTPSAVREADIYLSQQLQKIQSGRTSYSDQVREMMDKIMNREKFSYDVDTDPLFQQALASAMKSGKQAMTDTVGQASALTGGYGSTYATSAGNQSYNAFIEDAYNNLPQYYQMALEAYQMEGDEMYRQFGMVSELDDKEFNRNIAAYDATYQHRNRQYDEAYNRFRDSKSDALAMANLQLNEHGQRVNDAYNYYNVASDTYNTLYNEEYTAWADAVNLAWRETEMLNNDWWKQTEFDEGVRQFDVTTKQNAEQFAERMAFDEKWNQKQMDNSDYWNQQNLNYQYAALNQKSSGGGGSGSGSGSGEIPSDITSKVKSFKNNGERNEYVADMVESGYITEDQGFYLLDTYNSPEQLPLSERTWSVTDKGGWKMGSLNDNAKVKDQYDNEMSISDIYDELKKTMGKDAAKSYLVKLQKDLGITK